MSIRTQLLTGLKWTVVGRVATQVVTWTITLYVMRLVAPDDYGLMALAAIFSTFFSLVAEIGLGSALVRSRDITQRQLRQIFGIVLLSNAAVFALMATVVAPLAADFFGDSRLLPVVRVISLQFLPAAFAVVPAAMLAREMAFGGRAAVDFASSLGGALLTLVLAHLGHGVFALAWGSVACAAIRSVGLNALSPSVGLPVFRFAGCGDMFHFGRNVAQTQFVWFFYSQADSFIVGKLLGKHDLGIYSVSMELASLPAARVSAILNQLATPALSKLYREGKAIGPYLTKGMRAVSLFAFPVMWGISCVAPELVDVILGPTWEQATVPLALLCLMMPLRILSVFLASALQSVGRADVGFRNICATAVAMCSAFVVTYRFGLVGLSLSWVIVFPAVFWFNLTRSCPHLGVSLKGVFSTFFPSAVASSAMYAVVGLVRGLLPWPPWANLMLLVVAGAASYIAASCIINRQGMTEAIDLVRRRESALAVND